MKRLCAVVVVVCFVLLFALCLKPVQSFKFFSFKRKKAYDMRKFLNTEEPIWTYNTTKRTNVWCEVNVKHNFTESSIFFTRSSYDRKGRTTALLEGKFVSDRKKHMDMSSPDGVYMLNEDIVYMSDDRGCAVIAVTSSFDGQKESFDLRVRNSSLTSGITEKCKRKFSKRVPEGQIIYKPQCQRILDRGQRVVGIIEQTPKPVNIPS
uniref:Putative group i salivary lipocalin n=1 Tax=Rhipicephalus pulchellus TaxID=72859 RepID=L7LT70_RHIPC